MAKKRRTGRKADLEYFEMALCHNGQAIEEGPKRKTWSMHDLKNIQPLTPTQEDMFQSWCQGQNICAHGSAGTGKTFLALYLALEEVLSKRHSHIVIVRSAVATRDVGALPGTLEEKLQEFERPYKDILHELLGRVSSYQDMKTAGLIDFQSTSYLRGRTWDNAVVLIDEAENCTFHEIDSIMTRTGENTKVIVTGDTKQTDLDGSRKLGKEGLSAAMQVFERMNKFDAIGFNIHDCVRGPLCKSWIQACEDIAA